LFFFYVLYVRKNGKFRAETYVKNRLHSAGLQVAVQIKIAAGKIGSRRRSNNGDYLFPPVQGGKKRFGIVRKKPGLMGAGLDAASTADTEVMVYRYRLSRAVIAVFYRTRGDTGMTVNALFFINPNNRRQFFHAPPPENIPSLDTGENMPWNIFSR
jgi:hypothetical protein